MDLIKYLGIGLLKITRICFRKYVEISFIFQFCYLKIQLISRLILQNLVCLTNILALILHIYFTISYLLLLYCLQLSMVIKEMDLNIVLLSCV